MQPFGKLSELVVLLVGNRYPTFPKHSVSRYPVTLIARWRFRGEPGRAQIPGLVGKLLRVPRYACLSRPDARELRGVA